MSFCETAQLPQPGTPSFTPLLLRTLLSAPSLHGWTFDPNLFSVLLLALIVKKGGVIVDVLDEPTSSSRGAEREAGREKVVRVIQAVRFFPLSTPSLIV